MAPHYAVQLASRHIADPPRARHCAIYDCHGSEGHSQHPPESIWLSHAVPDGGQAGVARNTDREDACRLQYAPAGQLMSGRGLRTIDWRFKRACMCACVHAGMFIDHCAHRTHPATNFHPGHMYGC